VDDQSEQEQYDEPEAIYSGPSVVWCDKAPYYVQQNQAEVTHMADACADRYGFIYLDAATRDGVPLSHQVALRIGAISAVEKLNV
jgi:hypothetical protein